MEDNKELTLESLAARLGTMETSNQALSEQNQVLIEQNAALKAALETKSSVSTEAAKKPEIPSEPVTIDKRKYQFQVPVFDLGGNTYTAEEAATDNSILAAIVKIDGQKILKPVK